jgi:hypothetical protein
MPYDGDDRDWGDDHGDDWKKPPRETITHWHPSLPFVEITQTRYPEERTAEDDRFETWGFEILGPKEAEGYPLAYDGVAYTRGDHTEAEMTADMDTCLTTGGRSSCCASISKRANTGKRLTP